MGGLQNSHLNFCNNSLVLRAVLVLSCRKVTQSLNTTGHLSRMASRWPSDYFLFPKLKEHSSGIRFSSSSDAKIATENWLNGQGCGFYQDGLNKLVLRSDKFIDIFCDYVEK
ncbi:hypothetical protein AVEN_171305-1 [Araneus ventricosus]|uniref:Uncharacterized protein n=1 Tax=Araneus ventricosus TaxID=182803 RepID=A0A4Y2EBV7_ARAVE|nr:hypothetical protein AVEN_21693-1 [Araneus ventricosus]GBM26247.1 hypothetical protein AVEN_113824-1 [Araneus ventricosus]GBM26254.1 hypothetical protein AVEN_116445-1 [Araneus ventricosus]GBM26268.1 hypothetical protein AVEN_171305-1 [Araneus ventricosus]